MQDLLTINTINGVQRIDSRLVAEGLDIQHKNLLETVAEHKETIETSFGPIAFETLKSENQQFSGRPPRIAHLTKDQAEFITTLSRNTPTVIAFKVRLVKSFNQQAALTYPAVPATFKQALLALVAAEEEKEQLQLQVVNATEKSQVLETRIQEVQPMVDFAAAVTSAQGNMSLATAAKLLGQQPNKFNEFLREKHVLLSSKRERNMPDARLLRLGYFHVVSKPHTMESGPQAGRTFTNNTTEITPRGLFFLWRVLDKSGFKATNLDELRLQFPGVK